MLTCDEYLMPESLAAAFEMIERHRGGYRLVAGATDTLPYAREGRGGDVHYPAVVDLGRVAELDGVERRGDRIRLGANTPIAAFLRDPLLQAELPVMRHCAVWFADDQIREQATVGGNLINASPAADATPPLLAMNATVTFERRIGGERRAETVPLEDFVTGPGRTVLPRDAILTTIECDAMAGYGSAFEKVGHRRSLVISTVCVAALVQVDRAERRFGDVRLALGAVAPVPRRLREIERRLAGRPLTPATIRDAIDAAPDLVRSRSRQAYRREVVRNFIIRAIADALAEAGAALSEDLHQELSHA